MTGFDYYFLYLAIIFVPIIISRFIMEKAQSKLSPEMKVILLDSFSKARKYYLLILAGFMVLMYLLVKLMPDHSTFIAIGLLVILLVQMTFRHFRSHQKLKELGLPEGYIKSFRLSGIVITSGFIVYIIVLLWVTNSQNDSNEAGEHAWKGYDLSKEKKYKEAITEFDLAISIDSSQSGSFINRGNAKYELHDTVGACEDYKKAQALGSKEADEFIEHVCK